MDQLDFRIQTQVTRLQRLLPPSSVAAYRQVAERIRFRLPFLLASPDWERNLLREVRSELTLQQALTQAQTLLSSYPAIGPTIAAILAVIAALMILIGQIQGKESEAALEKLRKAASKLLPEVERERDESLAPIRHRPR